MLVCTISILILVPCCISLFQDAITVCKGDLKKLVPEECLNDNLIDLKKRFGTNTSTDVRPQTEFSPPTSGLSVKRLSQEQRESRFLNMQEPLIDMTCLEPPYRTTAVSGLSLSTNRTPPKSGVSVLNSASQGTQQAGQISATNLKLSTDGNDGFSSLTSTNLSLLNKPIQPSQTSGASKCTDLLNSKSPPLASKAEHRKNLNLFSLAQAVPANKAVGQTRSDVHGSPAVRNVPKESHRTAVSKPLSPVHSSPLKLLATTLPIATTNPPECWLTARLLLGGMTEPLALDCEQKLVYKEGFSNVRDFAECPPTLFHRAYLTSIGITGLGIQQQLLRLHSELHAQYQQSVVNTTTAPASHKTNSDGPANTGSFSNISATSFRQDNNNSIISANATASNNKRVRSDSLEYGDIIEHQYVPAPPCKKM